MRSIFGLFWPRTSPNTWYPFAVRNCERWRPSCPVIPVISARFMRSPSGASWYRNSAQRGGFVGFADRFGRTAQPVERAQEPAIRLVLPAYIAAAPPTGLPQAVQPAVVADAVVRVALDVVAPERAELRPRVEEARPARAHGRDGVAPFGFGCASAAASASSASAGSGSSTVSGGPDGESVCMSSHSRRDRRSRGHRYRGQMPDRYRSRSPSRSRKRPRRRRGSCWCGTRSPNTPVRCCRAACPASTCPRRAAVRPMRPPNGSPCSRSRRSTRARSNARPRPRSSSRSTTRSRCDRFPGVIEADYGEWTGGKIADLAKTDEWKVVQVAPSRARFPGRRDDSRDAGAYGRRARRGRSRTTRTRPSSSSATPIRSSPRSRTTPACTSICSSGCTCRPRRRRCSTSTRTAACS